MHIFSLPITKTFICIQHSEYAHKTVMYNSMHMVKVHPEKTPKKL